MAWNVDLYLGGAMKIIGRFALAAVATAGLVFATSGPAAADVVVNPHKHCVLTPDGWVLIAEGLSENAPVYPALREFHLDVHSGEPSQHLTIRSIPIGDEDCSRLERLGARAADLDVEDEELGLTNIS